MVRRLVIEVDDSGKRCRERLNPGGAPRGRPSVHRIDPGVRDPARVPRPRGRGDPRGDRPSDLPAKTGAAGPALNKVTILAAGVGEGRRRQGPSRHAFGEMIEGSTSLYLDRMIESKRRINHHVASARDDRRVRTSRNGVGTPTGSRCRSRRRSTTSSRHRGCVRRWLTGNRATGEQYPFVITTGGEVPVHLPVGQPRSGDAVRSQRQDAEAQAGGRLLLHRQRSHPRARRSHARLRSERAMYYCGVRLTCILPAERDDSDAVVQEFLEMPRPAARASSRVRSAFRTGPRSRPGCRRAPHESGGLRNTSRPPPRGVVATGVAVSRISRLQLGSPSGAGVREPDARFGRSDPGTVPDSKHPEPCNQQGRTPRWPRRSSTSSSHALVLAAVGVGVAVIGLVVLMQFRTTRSGPACSP